MKRIDKINDTLSKELLTPLELTQCRSELEEIVSLKPSTYYNRFVDNENELINMETDKDISISAKGNISIQAEEEISFTIRSSISRSFAIKSEVGIEFVPFFCILLW